MKPYKIDNDVAYFYLRDVEDYGCPSNWGYTRFFVIDNEPIYAMTSTNNANFTALKKLRTPHLYDRVLRFRNILTQLLGFTLNVSKQVQMSDSWLDMLDEVSLIENNHWYECRKILKKYKFNGYYNSIPAILKQCLFIRNPIKYSEKQYLMIMNSFIQLHRIFSKVETGRKYFPNLRYVALKLIELNGLELQFEIPLLVTNSKCILLDNIFIQLRLKIQQVEDSQNVQVNRPIEESKKVLL